jgi:hypothetical protein
MILARHIACMEDMKNCIVLAGNLNGIDHLENLHVGGKILKRILKEIRWKGANCNHLTQDTGQGLALVNILVNLQTP